MHDLVPHERSTDDDPAIFSTANTSPTSPTSPHVPNTPTSNGHEDSARVSPESHDRDLTLGVRHSTFRLSLGYDCAPERHHSQMAWHDVAFRIKSKAILRPMDGVARSGRLLAIMGPSGSGKTTLLHCLAGRRRRMTGSVFVNFLPVTAAVMHRTISFVPQEDHLLGFLTVQETIRYATNLQLRASAAERQYRVEQVIKRSGLDGVRKSKVGSAVVRGVSGGEKRRLSIAVEVVGDKPILLLDEPTSGLDSAAAYRVALFLQDLARSNGTTVACTIHQPSAKVFALFDDLLVLTYGRPVYYSGAASLGAHLATMGHAVPRNVSPIEYALDLINIDFVDEGAREAERARVRDFAAESMALCAAPTPDHHPRPEISGAPSPSGCSRLGTLLHRGFVNANRNWIYYWVRIVLFGALALVSGTIWQNTGTATDDVQNRLGILFFGIGFPCFMSVASIPAFLEERQVPDRAHMTIALSVVMRELQTGYYGIATYVLSSTITALPFLALTAFVYSGVGYWLFGLYPDVGRFLTYTGVFFAAIWCAEYFMLLIAAVVPVFVIALALAAFGNGFFMLPAGFLVRFEQLPSFWVWAHYVGYHKYAYEAMCKNEFPGLVFLCSNATPPCRCSFPDALNARCRFSGEAVLLDYGYQDTSIVGWTLVLIGMGIAYRGLFWLVLDWKLSASLK